jgi:hydrogenase maturation protein HypF
MIGRLRIELKGITQGVGFRPTVYGLVSRLGLAGFVINDAGGVLIEVEGPASLLGDFRVLLRENLPRLARIDEWTEERIAPRGERGFRIAPSRAVGGGPPPIPPDVAICAECRRELFDPRDRRYLYPFITCTLCGPRFTVVREIPFDRERTSMDRFPLCERCREEYENPLDRRFHAQTVACARCGPRAILRDSRGRVLAEGDPAVRRAAALLAEGAILGIKGIGGFHLAVDARDPEAVERLRQRKRRPHKPFAVMSPDLERLAEVVVWSAAEEKLWGSPQAPILLLRKRALPAEHWAERVAPANPALGVMPAYTPLHLLLFAHPEVPRRPEVLVMTSGNLSDEPIQYRDEEAVEKLGSLVDGFLTHDREILIRCDDSIFVSLGSEPTPVRIGRGMVPAPLPIRSRGEVLLGVGAELKNAIFYLGPQGGFFSSHVGDLKTLAAYEAFQASIARYSRFFGLTPVAVGCDLHPDYLSTRWARERSGLPVVPVQHHHAHVVAAMAEHGIRDPVIGIAYDGTGLGEDGTIWGGEILVATRSSFQRAGMLRPFPLPGGERAIREPSRLAFAALRELFGEEWRELAEGDLGLPEPTLQALERMLEAGLNCPRASSAGRLFDAVAAFLGICRRVTFEGEAAIALEALAARAPGQDPLPFAIEECGDALVLDHRPMWRALAAQRRAGAPAPALAAAFIEALAAGTMELCRRIAARTGIRQVIYSGGVFQNRLLVAALHRHASSPLETLHGHRRVPPNDAGVAVGQAVVAEEKIQCA